MKKIIVLFLLLYCNYTVIAQNTTKPRVITGTIFDENRLPLLGASIKTNISHKGTLTDKSGNFQLEIASTDHVLIVSFVGYEEKTLNIEPDTSHFVIMLIHNVNSLKEVVVSSGYQQFNQKNTTGSYGEVGKDILERSVSTDVISKLDGVTPSLAFDNRAPDQQNLSIRGRSTILSDNSPLIVLDNFPYDGDLHNINPNDIENITILKDAASSAIWGARAGNGVIVITTKHGKYNQQNKITLTSNLTIAGKPDLYYNPSFLNSADFINVEEQLYNKGFYSANITSPAQPVLSPVVDLLNQVQNGQISAAEANAKIELFKNDDVRKDFEKYFYQKSINQQYNLNLSGGSENYNYYISGGYDHDRSNFTGNYDDRYTFNAINNFRPFKNLSIGADINYTSTKTVTNNPGFSQINSGDGYSIYPYAQLADASGNPLAIAKDYPLSFTNAAESQGYLDWQYRPLEEIKLANNVTSLHDIRLKFDVKYNITLGLNAEALYQYESANQNGNNIYSQDTYYTRNLINEYMQPGQFYPIPLGGILTNKTMGLNAQSGRFQLNYNKLLGGVNQLTAIAGAEIRDTKTLTTQNQLYGYDSGTLISQPVDYLTYFSLNPGAANSGTVPYFNNQQNLVDRYVSEFINVNYNYAERYFLSASARKDASNLFGVNTNQKWVPLYSFGGGWEVSKENFYHNSWLPYLKFRATYGYTGNVNKSVTAFTTATYQTDLITGLPNALILTPPNPDLRWEKVRTINLGIDFATKANRVAGSIEYYLKKGTDQLGSVALDPTTGFFISGRYSTLLNSSDLMGKGIDIELNTINTMGLVKWRTRILFNYSTDIVTKYDFTNPLTDYFSPDSPPLVGKPVLGVYSFKWAGLDHETGDPMVYFNGVPSKDYSAIASTATINDLVYNGPALPPYFGSIMNTFTYKQISLSANLTYKFGYYFHRSSISYSNLINNWQGNQDFTKRWQKPGDEQKTNVPSLSLDNDPNCDLVYINSSTLVDKGDNIRLKDIQLSYTIDHFPNPTFPVKQLTIYGYVDNIGILWRANKDGLDPDYYYGTYATKPITTYSIGFRANF